jgi:hypothetical protein
VDQVEIGDAWAAPAGGAHVGRAAPVRASEPDPGDDPVAVLRTAAG